MDSGTPISLKISTSSRKVSSPKVKYTNIAIDSAGFCSALFTVRKKTLNLTIGDLPNNPIDEFLFHCVFSQISRVSHCLAMVGLPLGKKDANITCRIASQLVNPTA